MKHNIIGVVGWKNSGKTTLVAGLVQEFTGRGLRVSVVKHAHHTFEIDQPGKDSYRARNAGAAQVAIVSAGRWALIHELRNEPEPSLEEILSQIRPCDLLIVEGYKTATIPKIEVRNSATVSQKPLAPDDPHIIAVASDTPADDDRVPHFHRDDIVPIAEFILERVAVGVCL